MKGKRLSGAWDPDAHTCGVSFAIEGGPSHYLPVGHAADNLEPGKVWGYLRDQMAGFQGELVGANLQYDLSFLSALSIRTDAVLRDVQVAQPLLWEHFDSYSLDAIAGQWELPGKDESGLDLAARFCGSPDAKKCMRDLPARAVAQYAIRDVTLPLEIYRLQEARLDLGGYRRAWELECRVTKTLVAMHARGTRIDLARLRAAEATAFSRERAYVAAFSSDFLVTDQGSGPMTVHDREAVIRTLGIPEEMLGETDTGEPSIDVASLEPLQERFPRIREYLAAKQWNKLRTTFLRQIDAYRCGDRIRCTYRQCRGSKDDGKKLEGAAYGRMSCKDPNLQQQPSRNEEIGSLCRSIYVPEDGELCAALDYSSQEPRWAVHVAAEYGLPSAAPFVAMYNRDPAADLHQMVAEMASVPRKIAKIVLLGIMYGMGKVKLARTTGMEVLLEPKTWAEYNALEFWEQSNCIGTRDGCFLQVPSPAATELLDRFHERVPFARQLKQHHSDLAKAQGGYIKLTDGRKCRFPRGANFADVNAKWRPRIRTIRASTNDRLYGREVFAEINKALNRDIQGSAAVQTKTALCALEKAGFAPRMAVHDEIVLSVASKERAAEAARIMETCYPMRVPSKVDAAVGSSWSDES